MSVEPQRRQPHDQRGGSGENSKQNSQSETREHLNDLASDARILFPIVSHPQTIEKRLSGVDPFNRHAVLTLHFDAPAYPFRHAMI